MPDNLNDPGPEDGKLISLSEDHELDGWCAEFGITRQRLREAVAGAGSHSVKAVRAYLEAEDCGE